MEARVGRCPRHPAALSAAALTFGLAGAASAASIGVKDPQAGRVMR
jgi:hypothetical protein